jgi:hypothetical protein
VIEELDVKKNAALQSTWVKVNGDFGNIFSTLLPGTSAKLDPPEGGTVLDGLEVKVSGLFIYAPYIKLPVFSTLPSSHDHSCGRTLLPYRLPSARCGRRR